MIRTHEIPARDFALLAAGGGDRQSIEVLLAGQFSRRLLLLQAVRESAGTGTDEAYSLLEDVQQDRPDVIRAVLTLPCVGLWAAACLRDGPARECRYLSCLAATAALRANRCFEIEVPVWDGTVHLPTFGSVSLRAPSTRTARVRSPGSGGRASVVAGGEEILVSAGAPGWQPVRRLRASSRGVKLAVWLEDSGPFRGPAGLPLAPPLSPSQAVRWERLLSDAWGLLVRRHPEQAGAISAGLRVLTPMTSPGPGASTSVTAAEAFGAVLLTAPADAEGLALTLLHEHQHGKLAALHQMIPLHSEDSRALWYARWRDDPRPVSALLHGAYAHLGVAGFWRAALRSDDGAAAEEFIYWCDAVGEALDQLSSSGAVTDAGTRFIAGMSSTLTELGSVPIPAGPRRRAADRGLCDRMTWRMRHLSPDPGMTDRYSRAWLTGTPPPEPMPAVTLRPADRGTLGSAWLVRARRTAAGQPARGQRATAADMDYASGHREQALAGYVAVLMRDPADHGAWAGLALTLGNDQVREFLADHAELARAVAVRVRSLSGNAPDPVGLSLWIAALGRKSSVL
jgi:HEXXH motif-containing protein